MEVQEKLHLLTFLAVVSILIPSFISAEPLIYSELRYENGSAIDHLIYDRQNSTISGYYYGSNSYMDNSYTTSNLLLRICNPLLSVNHQIDLVYTSESGNLTASVVEPYLAEITSTSPNANGSGTSYCADTDIVLASTRALYPGYITPRAFNSTGNITDFDRLEQELNGSFKLGVSVTPYPKEYQLFVREIYDDQSALITTSGPQLVMSLVDAQSSPVKEDIVALFEPMNYDGQLLGGESIWVNGIMSLEIRLINPCEQINESGYYLLNQTLLNANQTCFTIENSSNIVFNFGDEMIDGDNLENGSLSDDSCPINIINSQNITIESLRTQQFSHGICIRNSSVIIIGNNTVYNINGALIENQSTVYMINLYIGNNTAADITAKDDSYVNLRNVTFETARLVSEFMNINVSSVPIEPEPPNVTEIDDIDQFIEFNNLTESNSWAEIKFYYTEPLPNGVVINNISVYDYNGTYGNYSVTEENVTVGNLTGQNVTTYYYGWHDGEWKNISTLVSPTEGLIMSMNLTSFSVFAPYGFVLNNPEPEPTPTPTPMPSGGGGGGGGSTPAKPSDLESSTLKTAIRLKLELPETVTARQGQAIDVPFNLSNIGDISAYNITISTSVYRGWESTNYTNESLAPGMNISDVFSIAPYEKATPKEYYLPVSVEVKINNESLKVIQDVLHIVVIPRGNLSRLRVLEYPPSIEIWPRQELDVGFLVENIGDLNLNNIKVKFDPSICLTNISGINNVSVGETKLIHYKFTATAEGVCNYNVKFYSGETLVGFVPVKFVIKKAVWIQQPIKTTILLFILIIWTMFTMVVLSRKRVRKKEIEAE